MSNESANLALTELEKLDIERRRLECEKLRVEIVEASQPWWKRAGYLGALVPVLLAIGGLATAVATGYFDRERQRLQIETRDLTEKRDQLVQQTDDTQAKIDTAYLQLASASAEARYALGHIKGVGFDKEQRSAVDRIAAGLPSDQASTLRSLLNFVELTNNITQITEQELGSLDKSLHAIPASRWAADLRPTLRGLYGRDRILFEAPDGKLYDPVDRRYYSREELEQNR